MNALIGKKLGMTQIFDEQGHQVPVTAVLVGPCTVTQRRTAAKDGYEAIQLGFGAARAERLDKPRAGHFKKAGVAPQRFLREVLAEGGDAALKVGDTVTAADVFTGVSHVDVIGITKGRGFQGVIRRHGMTGGRKTHGSGTHREVGSVGMRELPGRIMKNKRMPGHMGHVRVTAPNLRVVGIRATDHVLLLKGSVPGPTGGLILVRKSIKKADVKS